MTLQSLAGSALPHLPGQYHCCALLPAVIDQGVLALSFQTRLYHRERSRKCCMKQVFMQIGCLWYLTPGAAHLPFGRLRSRAAMPPPTLLLPQAACSLVFSTGSAASCFGDMCSSRVTGARTDCTASSNKSSCVPEHWKYHTMPCLPDLR